MNGKFIISLDFELMWGIRDKKNVSDYSNNILGVHFIVPQLLETFNKYKVKATFAIVGLLYFKDKVDLLNHLPAILPTYTDKSLNPYLGYIDKISAYENPYHFAPELIKQIHNYSEHEIGSHTFSHYYCLEDGQNIESFKADIEMAQKVAYKHNINLTSLIFPRNQFNDEYLQACHELGIICIRGNEHSWLYRARNRKNENMFRRLVRLLDAYINISGHNCYSNELLSSKYPINIPSSRFLRPFSHKLKYFESLRLNRIKSGMTYAAKHQLTFHLWWHPHNFGINKKNNLLFLEKILNHYVYLNNKYNFESQTMSGLAKQLLFNSNENEKNLNGR